MKSFFTVIKKTWSVPGFVPVLLLILALAGVPTTHAATVTASPSGSCANIGSGNNWSNRSNANASDNSRVNVSLDDWEDSKLLGCTGFGFSIPLASTINGITLRIERRAGNASRIQDSEVYLLKDGVAIGDNKANTASWYPTSDTYATYGGATDKWGTTWTPAEINAANFGAGLKSYKNTDSGGATTVEVDHMEITIDYTLGPPSVLSISRADFDPTTTNKLVSWTVTFTDSVTDVDAGDFALVQAGGATGASITSVTGSGTTWTVTANTGSGTAGTVRLNLVDNDTIAGSTGLMLGGTGVGNGNYTGEYYTLIPPTCTGVAPEIFCDDFERSSPGSIGNGWTITPGSVSNCTGSGSNTGCAGIDSDIPPFNTYANPRANPTRSMFTRWNVVTATSPVINLAGRPGAQLSFWMRRGHDDFSECPEASGEDYQVQYKASDGSWKVLALYPSSPSAALCDGKIFTPVIELPTDALHANFQVSFYQPSGSGKSGSGGAPGVVGYDYWHMDNIIVRETTQETRFTGAFCDNFEGGLNRWSIGAEGAAPTAAIGDAGLGTLYNISPTHSLDLRWGYVTATTFLTDLTGVTGDITYWVKSGVGTRDPATGHNLVVEYLNSSGNWITLATYLGTAAAGTVFNGSHPLPNDAKHADFRLRYKLVNGGKYDKSYWHIDDACVGTIVPTADLAMIKTRNNLLTPGSSATYSLSVKNNGPDAVSGSISVVDTLPTGLSFLSATGSGWTCSANGQVVTCDRATLLANGDTTPIISLVVNVAAGLTGTVTNTATVSGTVIDNTAANNTAGDTFTIAPFCLSNYTFDGANNASPGTDWRTTSSSGSFGQPRIFGNRLRLTDATNNVATAAHLQKKFPAAGNKIVVEFDYYGYGGSGADGIALTFSDATVTPHAGAYGGSLGYAQRSGISGFAGGWLGIGLDEFGNFRNDEEGRGDGPPLTGRVVNSVSIRGSGSGTSGYLLQAESGELDPGVATASGHRYRITIDHSDSNNAWVKVDRNSGSGFSTIIPQYNAKGLGLGQAAVPENWLLSFTGSTGGSTNIHEIDNLSVCAAQPILSMGPDHYVISHSGTGLTCEAEPVTFTAHDASHSRTDATGQVLAISTSSSSGTWVTSADSCSRVCYNSSGTEVVCAGSFVPTTGNNGQASYTFASGETGVRLCLRHNATGTVNINVTDGTASEGTGTASAEPSPGADPSLVFSNTGFRFYANGNVDSLGNLTAGLRSDTIEATLQPAPQTITVRALKSAETTPPRCVPLLGSTAKTVKFAYQCIDHAACHPSSSGLEINGTAVAGSAAVPVPASNVSVTFDGSGSGTINLKYWDVGTIKLFAAASISDGVSGGTASIATGSSNTFLVKPYGFNVKACTGSTPCTTANASAIDGTGSVFARAGDTFKATVTAVAYGGSVTTPSFGLGSGSSTETVLLSRAATVVAPTPGVAGTLSGTGSQSACTPVPQPDCLYRSAFSDGVVSVSDLTWSEAGVTTLTATNTTFQTVASGASGTSGNIGRFTPHHFGVTGSVVTRSDMQLVEGQATPFTYMGEPMRLALVVTAFSRGETPTSNYRGSFAKLDAATLGANIANWTCTVGAQCMGLAAVSGANLTNRLNLDLASTNSAAPSNTAWNAGVSTFTLYAGLNRAAAPDGPFANLQLGAKPLDSDGITLPLNGSTDVNHCVDLDITAGGRNALCTFAAAEAQLRRWLFETDVRFGRLRLLNFYGSELLQPRVEYRAEFWDGNRWMTNALDNTSPLVAANLATGGLAVNNITALTNGVGFITFNIAAAGSFDIAANLNSAGSVTSCNAANPNGITPANMEWLQALWSSNCNGTPAWQQDPNARVRLGSPKAPYIYLRERY